MKSHERICHLGVPIDNLTPRQSIYQVIQLLRSGETCQHLVTLSIGMYLEARRNQKFYQVLNSASLVIPESSGLAMYSLLSPPRLTITPGGQLARDCVTICGELGGTIAIFGSSQQNREDAIRILRWEDPKLKLVNVHGNYKFDNKIDSEYVADKLDRIKPAFAVMAGNEVQAETWINEWIINKKLNVKLIGNFGQSVDVWGGQREVPPKFFRDHKLGWLIRILIETPERRKKYAKVLLAFGKIGFYDLIKYHANRFK